MGMVMKGQVQLLNAIVETFAKFSRKTMIDRFSKIVLYDREQSTQDTQTDDHQSGK